jgi:septal ring factor EnvC (AmiA/AmiB activator)
MIFLSSIKTFLLTKTRLVIEYFLIGFVITLAGVTFTLWLKNKTLTTNLEITRSNITQLTSALETQDKTINDLKELRTRDANAIDGLVNDYRSIAQSNKEVNDRLANLEKTNEEVRRYMRDPLPAAIKCVLNNTCKDSDKVGVPKTPSNPHRILPANK